MRKLLLALACLLSFSFVVPATISAVDVISPACDAGTSGSTACRSNQNEAPGNNTIYGPNGVLTRVAQVLAMVAGIAAVIMIIIAGLRFVLANGDPNSIASARSAVIYALIGVTIAAMAQGIILFVLNKLG